MENYRHFRVEKDGNGFVHLYFDYADGSMNVLGQEVLLELSDIFSQMTKNPPLGLAIKSAKDNGFIAGANVKEFTKLNSFDDAFDAIELGQGVMTLLDELKCPTIAVINGLCLGGGLELALACDYRIAVDSVKAKIGLPEVKLGIHPGFGGMVRAVRLLGPVKAMNMVLTGKAYVPQQARKMGLVDFVVPQRLLDKSVDDVLLNPPKKHKPTWTEALTQNKLVRGKVAEKMYAEVSKKAREDHYPAPYRMIDLWKKYSGNEKEFMIAEAVSAAKLSQTETAKNLLRVFMLQDLVKGSGDKSLIDPKRVHVIGAGAMGGDIAVHCAMQGMKVTLQDISDDMLAGAMKRAHKACNRKFRGKVHLINEVLDRLMLDKNGLGIPDADVVIEAVVENVKIKQGIYKTLEAEMKPDAIIATNTSSILLEVLSEKMCHPQRLVGLHFFNPVALMPLVEVVYTSEPDSGVSQPYNTDPEIIAKAAGFCRHINKLPIQVKSSPGFLVNRVLMPTLIEAITMIDRDNAPMHDIDNAFTDFGMPMGPLHLADTVGLDVVYFVMGVISKDLGLVMPERLEKLVKAGKLGIKTGEGFYKYKNGKKKDIKSTNDVEGIKHILVTRLVEECEKCLSEGLVESADLIDAGMIFGAGFAPFRGGPLHYQKNNA